jgi:tRNA-specific 2-thiouridylase
MIAAMNTHTHHPQAAAQTALNSLGFNKAVADTRVVVAMSGGVDSSVVAAMLRDEGYDVIGITLQLYDHGAAIQKKGACCAGQDIYDARQVAEKIGIPHYILDYESAFKQSVMDDFADSYLRGETPIPCVRCNQNVKFRDLLLAARDLGADCLATGHYVQRVMSGGHAELHRAVDPTRDQSYFLFATTTEQLDYLRFPLGGLPKTETRRLAEQFALPVAVKPDSQDICFVPDGRYVDVVAKMRPGGMEAGDIVHLDGTVLGRHNGIIHYTVGQRKGLNIQARSGEARDPLFVIGLDAAKRHVIVGPHEALGVRNLHLKEFNLLCDAAFLSGQDIAVTVKFRSSMEPVAASLRLSDNGRAVVMFTSPQFGIAPGQACVVYDDMRVLGGGWIVAEMSSK